MQENGTKAYRILNILPDLQIGGGQQVVLTNVAHMDRQRFQNIVCYLLPFDDMEPLFKQEGIVPICLNHRTGWGIQTLFQLVRLIRQQRIDVVHVHTSMDKLYGQLAAMVCRVPVVSHLHSIHHYPEYHNGVSFRALAKGKIPSMLGARGRAVMRYWAGRLAVKRFIAVSKAVQKAHSPFLPAPVSLVYNSVPAESFARPLDPRALDNLRRELGLVGVYPVLINVARLVGFKGQRWLIPMMSYVVRRWPDARLLIVGEGEKRAELEREIKMSGLGQCIMLLGRRLDVAELLAISHVFVFPSINEPFGLAPLEAMAAGKPVVAFRSGGVPEFVEHGKSGYLVEPKDSQAMASKVQGILEDPELAQLMGKRGQRIAQEKFSVDASVRALEGVYMRVLEEEN